VIAPFAGAQVSSSGLNQWTLAAAMNAPRAQACSAILQDGSMLVAGGLGSSGAVNTAEIYGTGGAFTATSPMNQARSGAACATLMDGTVLVMGGDDGTGALSTAEIFNPSTQTWKITGSLNAPREGHQAVVNGWGAVWVAGGTNASGIVAALEEFDPPTGTFRTVGTLTTPRTEFAMALLPGLKVMIAGGTNGTATIGSVEIYNGVLGTVAVAGAMAQARQDFAAAALPDGTVLITGGRDVKGNLLSSTEIFDPVQGVSAAGPGLLTPRAYHSAYGLANNGQVLIAGGTGSSGVLSSTETYAPWTGAIQQSAPLNVSRRDNVSAVLRPGSLLVAGGRNDSGSLNSSELFQYVAIGTDKPDYAPGTPVNISGSGWQPGEQVSVQIMTVPVDQHHIEFTGSGVADGAGNVTITGFAVDQSHLGMKFILTAAGSQLNAQTTFTDGSGTPTIAFSFNPPSGTAVVGQSVAVTVTLTGASGPPTGNFTPCLNGACNQGGSTTNSGTCVSTGQIYTLPSSGPATCQFTIPSISGGNTIVAIAYGGDANYASVNPPNDGATYSVQSPTTTSMTSGPSGSQPYGSTTPYTATVTPTTGNFPTGQVQFYVSGGTIGANAPYGSPVSLTPVSPFTASFVPNPPLAVSATPYVVTAHFLGDPGDGASTSANNVTTTIITAPTVTTESFSANPIVYGQPLTVSGTVMSGGGIPTGTVTVTGITGTTGCSGVTVTPTGTYSCTITTPGPGVSGSPYAPINANYTPSVGTGYVASSSANGTLTVNTASTQVSAPNVTASSGTSFTFHAQATAVAPSVAPVSTGSISFYSLVGLNQPTAACAAGAPLATNVTVDGLGNASSGSVTLTASATPYTICAVYTPTGSDFTGSTSAGQNVTSPATQTSDTVSTPTGGPGVFGQPITITATVIATAGGLPPTPGTLTFNDDAGHGSAQIGTTQTVTATGATTAAASVTVSNLVVGAHGVTATYTSSNGAFASPTTSAGGIIIVTQASANFTVGSGAPNPVTPFGSVIVSTPVTLTATYTGGVSPAPTGSVNFINTLDGNAIVCTGTLSAGVATCNGVAGVGGNLPAGSETISITYVGDGNYTLGLVNTFSFTVTKAGTTTLLVPVPNPATVGNTITLSATVSVTRPSIAPTGTVSFTLGGNPPLASTCTGPISLTTNAGPPVTYTATCTFELTGPGGTSPTGVPITYTATYSGDANTLVSTGSNSLTSIGATTTSSLAAAVLGSTVTSETVGNMVTLTAIVSGILPGIPATGSFTFTQLSGNAPLNTTCLGTGTPVPVTLAGANYQAICSYEFAGPAASSITYKAVYGSDFNYLASTATDTLTTIAAATTTTLTAAVGGSTVTSETIGNTVVLTATLNGVAAGIAPNGSFTFSQSSGNPPLATTCLGTGTPVPVALVGVSYQAQCSYEFAGPGGSSVTYNAVYSLADPNYHTSTGTDTLTTLAAATTTTLTAAIGGLTVTSETVGNTVVLTATLNGLAAGIAPAGSFTFSQSSGNPPLATTCLGTGTPVPVALVGVSYQAQCSFEFAGPGGSSITYSAIYSLTDPNYQTSTGTDTLTTVAGVTTTTLTAAIGGSTVTSETVGNTVVLTATLNGLNAGIAPNGGFTFTQSGGNAPLATTCLGTGTPVPVALVGANYQAQCSYEFGGPGTATGSSSITYSAVYSATDPNYHTSTGTDTLNAFAAATTTALAATPNPATVGQTVTLTATVSTAAPGIKPTGTYSFTLGGNTPANSTCGSTVAITAATGVATCTFELAGPAGPITYTATYSGDGGFLTSNNSTSLTANKAVTTTSVVATPNPTALGTIVTLTATVSENPAGTPVAQATPFLGTFAFGLSGTLFSSTVANSATSTCGSSVPVSAAGVATCSFEIYSAANTNYTFTATYSGDTSFQGSVGSAILATQKAPTGAITFAVTSPASPAIPVVGQPLTLTVNVSASGSPTPLATPTGTVTVTGNGVNVSATLTNGVATVTNVPVLFAGSYTLSVTYSGDTNYLASAAVPLSPPLVIAKANSIATITTSGASTIITVTPSPVYPGSPTPTGLVSIYSGTVASGTPAASGVLSNGVFTALLPTGTYVAVYAGDNNYNASNVFCTPNQVCSTVTPPPTQNPHTPATSSTQLTSNINPVPANQPVVLTATVSGSGASSTPSGTVTFTSNGIVLGVGVVTGTGGTTGVASITTTLSGGVNSIVANYSGDSVYSGSSGILQLTVNKPPSTLLLSSSPSVAVFGQSVTLTVRITGSTQGGAALPTGTVTFFDNNVNIGVANVVNGVATLTLTSLPVGMNNFTVVYSGDANFGSTNQGNAGSVTVGMAQILATLAANTNNGQETLTATVAVVAPGAGTPTGTVTFIDTVTGQMVGTPQTLAGGMASITIPVTTDPIKAVYSGDGNFSASTTTNVSAIAVVNSASYAIDFAQDEIVTVFGSSLTAQTVTATLPLQTTLGGVSVMVTDSAGTARPALLFYVSATQIAFMIPAGTANGTATVAVATAAGTSTATISVTNSAPGLFTANDSGAGPLAAQVVSVAPGGAQTYTNTAALNGQSFVNAPIALTPAANAYFLLLYGTGIRFGSAITVSINGTTYTPTYAGAQGTYAGLDQINVLLPASLAGSGTVTVTVTVDGTLTNAGTIAFQ
jgi:hypothetical protein